MPTNYAELSLEQLLKYADAYIREGDEPRAQTVLLFALVKAMMT